MKLTEPFKKAPIPPEYLEALDGLALLVAQVGKNRVEIKQRHMQMLELHMRQTLEIQDIWDRLAGLDKNK